MRHCLPVFVLALLGVVDGRSPASDASAIGLDVDVGSSHRRRGTTQGSLIRRVARPSKKVVDMAGNVNEGETRNATVDKHPGRLTRRTAEAVVGSSSGGFDRSIADDASGFLELQEDSRSEQLPAPLPAAALNVGTPGQISAPPASSLNAATPIQLPVAVAPLAPAVNAAPVAVPPAPKKALAASASPVASDQAAAAASTPPGGAVQDTPEAAHGGTAAASGESGPDTGAKTKRGELLRGVATFFGILFTVVIVICSLAGCWSVIKGRLVVTWKGEKVKRKTSKRWSLPSNAPASIPGTSSNNDDSAPSTDTTDEPEFLRRQMSIALPVHIHLWKLTSEAEAELPRRFRDCSAVPDVMCSLDNWKSRLFTLRLFGSELQFVYLSAKGTEELVIAASVLRSGAVEEVPKVLMHPLSTGAKSLAQQNAQQYDKATRSVRRRTKYEDGPFANEVPDVLYPIAVYWTKDGKDDGQRLILGACTSESQRKLLSIALGHVFGNSGNY